MKIAWISHTFPYLPSREGFRIYGANLIKVLSQRGQIDLVSFLEKGDEEHLDWAKTYCASVDPIRVERASLAQRFASSISMCLWGNPLHYRAQLASLLRSGLQSRKWDVLHVEGGYVGGLLPEDLPIAKVLSVHDSWVVRCDEILSCSQDSRERMILRMRKFWEPRYERLVYPRFERCVVVAERDAEAVRRTVPNCQVEVVPNGTDTQYFHPLPVEKGKGTLVFHGHLGYAPNIAAALEFAKEIFPLIRSEEPGANFHLVGADPEAKIHDLASLAGVKLFPNLPDLRSAVCSGRVYVCAIRHGSGVKNKILEAMAMRLPIVCYPASIVGIDCMPGKHVLVACDPQEFAFHVVELLRNPERADKIAQAGRALVEEKYGWESRARSYEDLYWQAIEERHARQNRTSRR